MLLAASAGAQSSDPALERVLTQMDKTAAGFQSTQASFAWDQYQKVVDETETQKGKIYFRRAGKEIQMAAEVTSPDPKYVIFDQGKVQLYQPKIDQVTAYGTGKNRAEFESFLVLGFGGGGHDMLKSFDIRYLGNEKVNGVDCAKLDLVPKSQKVRNTFQHIVLWVDPAQGISLQQQLFEPSGDYRLSRYTDIRVNVRIPDSVFKLKTTKKTQFVSSGD
ncbi:MAG: outer membrane lipoprotein carrier protein LolA [Acidobacteria bacterium]|nr:outer membrane lipoprotein carrier protein LolA [Acidobacteriota bacterium]